MSFCDVRVWEKWLFVHKWSSLSCGSAGRAASMWWRRLGEKMFSLSLVGGKKNLPPWRSVRHSQVKSAKHSHRRGTL